MNIEGIQGSWSCFAIPRDQVITDAATDLQPWWRKLGLDAAFKGEKPRGIGQIGEDLRVFYIETKVASP